MKKMGKTVLSLMFLLSAIANAAAADEIKNDDEEAVAKFNLEGMLVEGAKDKFGNVITEQSYYRTGGDVDVVTRKEIEERHYGNLTDAIKRIPGVYINSPGYRGGEYNTAGYYNTSVSINGDDRVIVCIDGRRVDNAASGLFSGGYTANTTKALVNLDQITSIDNIEKIEIIKGPGASVYGPDATGGVINIITRKGSLEPSGSIDVSTGSWGHHVYKANYSGSSKDGSLRYFVSANRDMSGDTKYYDRLTKKTYRYRGTAWKDEGVNFSIDKEFDDKHSLRVSYNHTNGKDGYPITTPDWRYMSREEYLRIREAERKGLYGDLVNPGYRNTFYTQAFTGSYTAHAFNDIDVTYSFNKENGMESFVRIYNQSHNYWHSYGGFKGAPADIYPGHPDWDKWADASQVSKIRKPSYHKEDNRGVQFQLGKVYGQHDVLTGWTYDRANHKSWSTKNGRKDVDRNTYRGYIQDKIHIGDKWEITPAIRYEHYDAFKTTQKGSSETQENSSNSEITYAINTQYAFDDNSSIYFGWTRIHRPLGLGDYADDYLYQEQKLEDERGYSLTMGLRKNFSKKTSASINYNYMDMSNAIACMSVWDTDTEDWIDRDLNATQKKQAINLAVQHQFDQNWSLSGSYSHVKEEWKSKNGMTFKPGLEVDTSLINAYINAYRPVNQYALDLNYQKDKWNVSLLSSLYSGCSSLFTASKFFVMDMNLNYKINKNITAYLQVNNITNEGYELKAHSYLGQGAYAQPGRSFLIGMNYKF